MLEQNGALGKYNRNTLMASGRVACAFALLAALCVLSIFFFPGVEGPYPAVHGPVTALLSLRAAARLRVAIRAGVNAVRMFISTALFPSLLLIRNSVSVMEEPSSTISGFGSVEVLRC